MLRIAITPGEPAGVGPELVVRMAQKPFDNLELVAICDPELLFQAANRLNLPLAVNTFGKETPEKTLAGSISVIPIPLNTPSTPGALTTDNASYVIKTLEVAADLCLDNTVAAMVTGPVHKGIINEAGISFSGHTEFLAQRAGCEKVVMMLACPGLRVALATTHIPICNVAGAINQVDLEATIRILHQDLFTKFGLNKPRILICGLNPHAGEGGHMGSEEITIISPVIKRLREAHGWDLSNPLPADTLFTPDKLNNADAVLAMYHDQGLPVLKHKGFGQSVNITLGLPFIRTSVDHGTALDLAGSTNPDHQANLGSFETALATAITMANSQQRGCH